MVPVNVRTPPRFVGFWTPSRFEVPVFWSHHLLEAVDSYFHVKYENICVIPGNAVMRNEQSRFIHDSPSTLTTALKIASYFTLILPLIMLIAKIILRNIHETGTARSGIAVPQNALTQIKNLLPKIMTHQEDRAITWYPSTQNRAFVFGVSSAPHLIFKLCNAFNVNSRDTTRSQQVQEETFVDFRIQDTDYAQSVCASHGLHQLIIPCVQRLDMVVKGQRRIFLVEERIDTSYDSSIQAQLYQTLPDLDLTIKQLATFIIEAQPKRVSLENTLVIDPTIPPNPRRIAVIDFRRPLLPCIESAQRGLDELINQCLPNTNPLRDIVTAVANRSFNLHNQSTTLA